MRGLASRIGVIGDLMCLDWDEDGGVIVILLIDRYHSMCLPDES